MNAVSLPRRRVRSGFTLIELVVVIVILAILAAVIVPRFFGRTEDAKVSNAITTVKTLDSAIDMYNADTSSFPPNLEALINNPQVKGWNGPYLKNQTNVPLDPWGHTYVYKHPGDGNRDYDIASAGPDDKNAPIQSWNLTGSK